MKEDNQRIETVDEPGPGPVHVWTFKDARREYWRIEAWQTGERRTKGEFDDYFVWEYKVYCHPWGFDSNTKMNLVHRGAFDQQEGGYVGIVDVVEEWQRDSVSIALGMVADARYRDDL
jgi:hypothetical protein